MVVTSRFNADLASSGKLKNREDAIHLKRTIAQCLDESFGFWLAASNLAKDTVFDMKRKRKCL